MRFVWAVAISVGIHALLAAGLAVAIAKSPVRMKLAELDLTSVDLSFAETVEEKAPADSAPSAPSAPNAPPRPREQPAPERPKYEVRPDLPGEAVLPVPKDPIERMETPKVPEPEKPVEKSPDRPPAVLAPQSSVAAPAPLQARVDAPPKPKRAIRPEYPKRARERGEEGDVTLLLAVTEAGAVSSVAVVSSSGFPDLDAAAVRAAKAARFAPARLKDAPVASTARLTLSFRLR